MTFVKVDNAAATSGVHVVVTMNRSYYWLLLLIRFVALGSTSSYCLDQTSSVTPCRYDFHCSTTLKKKNSSTIKWIQKPIRQFPLTLHMGLYDKPLPQLPKDFNDDDGNNDGADSNNDDDDNDDDDYDDDEYVSERLFDFDLNGKEVRSLLPPLKRRLTSGVQCYYEPTDRIVQNLVSKTSVNYVDACWALEACDGNIQEAWTRISVARRMKLNQKRSMQIVNEQQQQGEENDPIELDWEEYDIDVEDEYNTRKAAIEAQDRKRNRDLYNKPSKPDDPWLPRSKPPPISDEPWFTG